MMKMSMLLIMRKCVFYITTGSATNSSNYRVSRRREKYVTEKLGRIRV